jgi:hypothetical protein
MSNPTCPNGIKPAVAAAIVATGFVCSCDIVVPFAPGDCVPNYGSDGTFGTDGSSCHSPSGSSSAPERADSTAEPVTASNNISTQSFTFVTAGQAETCGLKSDQTIDCWGNLHAPEGQFISVSVECGYACAVRSDQTIFCWGDSSDGQTEAAI